MNIELPQHFYYKKDNAEAYTKDDILFCKGNLSFERVMYHATYEIHGKETCFYCGCKLNEENRTLDHMYPRDFGGISITNNLIPCCMECNQQKNNMTMEEYFQYLSITDSKERKQYKNEVLQAHEAYRYKKGFFLPDDWYEYTSESTYVEILLKENWIQGKHYKYISEFYKKHGNFPRPVVKSENNKLLDGFLVLLFAKCNQIDEIPCVKLNNVIDIS